MFTGLIETLGTLKSVEITGGDRQFYIRCSMDLSTLSLGDSVATNGACLTVVKKEVDGFCVQVSEETLKQTTLSDLRAGAPVNLERALALGGRLDGHLVQGHVDTVGRVERISPRGRSLEIWFRVDKASGRYIINKGSIAVDGVSLTVNQVMDSGGETRFSVNIISHTQKKTTLTNLAPGREVNIETDLLGRYVERLLKTGSPNSIDEHYLQEKGF